MEAAAYVWSAYSEILQNESVITELGKSIPIPFFPADILTALCNFAVDTLRKTSTLASVRPPLYVVGDLHGNIFDLVRIFAYAGPPPESRFVFLGDYVDRGEYSVEVITLLLALYCKYPSHVILVRGNHEFPCVNCIYGFQTEITARYDDNQLYATFNKVFSYFPLAAVIADSIFCVHGGLSPNLKSIDQIGKIVKPVTDYDDEIISDLVWSDPGFEFPLYQQNGRGSGVVFGEEAVTEFMEKNEIRNILRAHQCVQLGVSKAFGENVYTIFSCSCYADATNNRCGLLFVNPRNEIQMFSMPPKEQLSRDAALFVDKNEITKPRDSGRSLVEEKTEASSETVRNQQLVAIKCQNTRRIKDRKQKQKCFCTQSHLPSLK